MDGATSIICGYLPASLRINFQRITSFPELLADAKNLPSELIAKKSTPFECANTVAISLPVAKFQSLISPLPKSRPFHTPYRKQEVFRRAKTLAKKFLRGDL
jgi:hypothetical protein